MKNFLKERSKKLTINFPKFCQSNCLKKKCWTNSWGNCRRNYQIYCCFLHKLTEGFLKWKKNISGVIFKAIAGPKEFSGWISKWFAEEIAKNWLNNFPYYLPMILWFSTKEFLWKMSNKRTKKLTSISENIATRILKEIAKKKFEKKSNFQNCQLPKDV